MIAFCVGPPHPSTALALPAPTTTGGTIALRSEAKEQIDSLEAAAAGVQAEIDALDTQVEQLTEQYNEIKLSLDQINGQLVEMRRRQEVAVQRYQLQTERIDKRLVATYKCGRDGILEILLATDSFGDFVSRLVLIAKIAVYDQDLADGLKEAEQELADVEVAIRAKKSEELSIRGKLEEQQSEIQTLLDERAATLAGINSSIAAVLEQERIKREEERKRLEAELRARFPGYSQYTGPLPQTPDALLNQLVETTVAYLSIPYLWAGEKPSTGMDCSGFVMYVFRQHGVHLPHFAAYQCAMGMPVGPADIQTGDIVGFGSPVHHVGIYIGDGLFAHAPRTGDVIRISRLADRADLTAIRRFPIQERIGPPALD